MSEDGYIMTNHVYFKTIIFNIWCTTLIKCALIIYLYNMRCVSIVATGVNTAATIAFPFLYMSILVDNMHDMFAKYQVENLSGPVVIVIIVLMLIAFMFSIVYILSYKSIFTQCVELNCFKGYTPLTEQKRKLNLDMIVSAVDDDNLYENLPDSELEKLEKYKALKRTDWFAVINLHLMINVIWGAAMTTALLTITYLMQTWSMYDVNMNREIDISVCSASVLILLAVTIVYDYFFFPNLYIFHIYALYSYLCVCPIAYGGIPQDGWIGRSSQSYSHECVSFSCCGKK